MKQQCINLSYGRVGMVNASLEPRLSSSFSSLAVRKRSEKRFRTASDEKLEERFRTASDEKLDESLGSRLG